MELAVKNIRNDESIKVEPVVDRDTFGIPGSPDIAETIFNNIDQAQIFVADVSIINNVGVLIGDICQEIQQSFELFWNHPLSVSVRTLISDQKPEYSQTSRYDKLHKYACDSNNYWPQVRARVKNIPKAFYDIVHSGDLIFIQIQFLLSLMIPVKMRMCIVWKEVEKLQNS